MLSHVQLFVTSWTVAYQDPLSMRFSRQEILEWVVIFFSRGSFQHRGLTHIPCMGRRILYHCAPWEACKENVWFVHTQTHTHTHIYTHNGIFIYPWNLYIYLLFIPKEEGNLAICNNMNKSGGYYNQWNKPVTEGKMLHDCPYMRYQKQSNS